MKVILFRNRLMNIEKRDTNANVSKSDESAALPAHVTEQYNDNQNLLATISV